MFTSFTCIQEAQLMLTNPRDAFGGQSRSPNMLPFDVQGMVSCYWATVTLSLRRAVFRYSTSKNDNYRVRSWRSDAINNYYITWGMVKTATGQNGDTKTATDCLDQNGDKLKRRQAKRRQSKTATSQNGDRNIEFNEV